MITYNTLLLPPTRRLATTWHYICSYASLSTLRPFSVGLAKVNPKYNAQCFFAARQETRRGMYISIYIKEVRYIGKVQNWRETRKLARSRGSEWERGLETPLVDKDQQLYTEPLSWAGYLYIYILYSRTRQLSADTRWKNKARDKRREGNNPIEM